MEMKGRKAKCGCGGETYEWVSCCMGERAVFNWFQWRCWICGQQEEANIGRVMSLCEEFMEHVWCMRNYPAALFWIRLPLQTSEDLSKASSARRAVISHDETRTFTSLNANFKPNFLTFHMDLSQHVWQMMFFFFFSVRGDWLIWV